MNLLTLNIWAKHVDFTTIIRLKEVNFHGKPSRSSPLVQEFVYCDRDACLVTSAEKLDLNNVSQTVYFVGSHQWLPVAMPPGLGGLYTVWTSWRAVRLTKNMRTWHWVGDQTRLGKPKQAAIATRIMTEPGDNLELISPFSWNCPTFLYKLTDIYQSS